MFIVFIPVIYFIALILAVAAVGVRLAVFLQKWIVLISAVLWLVISFFSIRSGRKEKNPEEKFYSYGIPIALIPILYTTIICLNDFVSSKGIWAIISLFTAVPLTFCAVTAVAIGFVWLGSLLKKHIWLGLGITAMGNFLILRFIYTLA